MESPKYHAFCLADPVFFDSPARIQDAGTRFEHGLRPAPDGWRHAEFGLWQVLTPAGAAIPEQGWKIHLSITVATAAKALDRAWDYCVARQLSFKFLRSEDALIAVNAKEASRGGSGKFITIYLADEGELARVLPEISARLAGFDGPYVLSDLRFESGPAYVRYGAFTEMYCADDDGEPTPALRAPDGSLVPDRRGAVFSMPGWMRLPEVLRPSLAARTAGAPGDFPYDVRGALQFSNGGGVYLAARRDTGEPLILKEARPFAGLDRNRADAVARLEHERAILGRLAGLDCVPRLLGHFTAWDHHFLAEEYIEGKTLLAAVIDRYPLAHPEPPAAGLAQYRDWAAGVVDQVARALSEIHARGVRFGDLHPGNVMVRPDGRVALIDFELAADLDEPGAPGLGAPGFTAPPGLSGADIDWHALECLRLFVLLPLAQLLGRDRSKAATLGAAAGRLFPAPASRAGGAGRSPAPPPGGSDRAADMLAGPLDWPALRRSLVAGIHASATPGRDDRLFPGDPNQFVTGGIAMRSGAAGVLLALHQAGEPVSEEYTDWLTAAARRGTRYVRGGLWDGLHGVALVLDLLGRPDDALDILDRARAERDGVSAVGLLGGAAGIALTLSYFADRTGDAGIRRAAGRLTGDLEAMVTGGDLAAGLRRPARAGLMRGMTGPALLFLHRYRESDDPRYLGLAHTALRQDLSRCAELADGTCQVRDGSSYLAYLDDGSAGIGMVLGEYLRHREDPDLTRALGQIRRACRAGYVFQPGLFRGRAGLIAALAQLACEPDRPALDEHVRRLGWHALSYRGHLAFPGTSLLRISMDLATGSAGVLLALRSVFEQPTAAWPFLGLLAPAATNQAQLEGGEFHVVRA
jgi:Protein kinase domain